MVIHWFVVTRIRTWFQKQKNGGEIPIFKVITYSLGSPTTANAKNSVKPLES